MKCNHNIEINMFCDKCAEEPDEFAVIRSMVDRAEKYKLALMRAQNMACDRRVWVVWTDQSYSNGRVLHYGINKVFTTKDFAMKFLEDTFREHEHYKYTPFSELEDLLESHIVEMRAEEY